MAAGVGEVAAAAAGGSAAAGAGNEGRTAAGAEGPVEAAGAPGLDLTVGGGEFRRMRGWKE